MQNAASIQPRTDLSKVWAHPSPSPFGSERSRARGAHAEDEGDGEEADEDVPLALVEEPVRGRAPGAGVKQAAARVRHLGRKYSIQAVEQMLANVANY